ncbi:MAG: hypothetical protein LBR10_04410 [Prevotellaceae bacterium]|nr:hypothetical protein [Prevotellaceae bacterium]
MSKQNLFDSNNPFQVTTPEDLSANDAVRLFVDVFTDFPSIINTGNTFLMGPRGVGKSMMFRYLQVDCQTLVKECSFADLPFIGIYIPIKNESFVKTELKRLDDRHASEIFNEHLMVSHISMKIFDSLLRFPKSVDSIDKDSLLNYYNSVFLPLFYTDKLENSLLDNKQTSKELFVGMIATLDKTYRIASDYAKKLAFTTVIPLYDGPLFDYQDFLIPLVSKLVDVKGFPSVPIFLLIDDAHILSEIQTRILNSWVATRTSKKISLKVSSQYNYKNYYTVTGDTIDAPHDYTEIDMTKVHTSNWKGSSHYKDRIQEIVKKRLNLLGINSSPEEFFPEDTEQEREIKIRIDNYNKAYDNGQGRGAKRGDDALRYARPDYIKDLAGRRKSSFTYSYAGFSQLVHLSSGIVRYFLEPANLMYSKERALNKDKVVKFISPGIQSEVARDVANQFLYTDLDKYKKEGDENAVPKEDIDRLANLIQGLGGLFRQILLSETRSERKVFSIAISDEVSETVEKTLNIGINLGFFHCSTIGRKNRKSGGRTKLYIMNRRLAPIWTLDPTGFAGYLFVQNRLLEDGIKNPQSMLSRIDRDGVFEGGEIQELYLFDDMNEPPIEVRNMEDD